MLCHTDSRENEHGESCSNSWDSDIDNESARSYLKAQSTTVLFFEFKNH